MTRELGLRYAPDLRFYLDDSLKQINDVHRSAQEQMKQLRELEEEEKLKKEGKLYGTFADMA